MPSIEIRLSSVADVLNAPNFGALAAEYAAECATRELGEPRPVWTTYANLEAAGVLHTFAAWRGAELIGFLVMLVSQLPHYGTVTAMTESIFVADQARKGGAGLRMLRAAEAFAREHGAAALMVSGPSTGRLAKVLPRLGFRECTRLFAKRLA